MHCFVSFLVLQIYNHLDGRERELVALLCLSFWCLVIVLFCGSSSQCPAGDLQCVIGIFSDHSHLLFFVINSHANISRYSMRCLFCIVYLYF